MSYTEQQLIAAIVSDGLRPALAHPECCAPEHLLMLIQRCWSSDPVDRPSFGEIVKEFKYLLDENQIEQTDKVPASVPSSEKLLYDFPNQIGCEKNLNWVTQGEKWSKMACSAGSQFSTWSKSLSVHVYQPTLSWGSFTTCGRRETMEDTHFMLPQMYKENDVHAFGIFDGHRGAAAAEFSASALPGFLQSLGSRSSPSDSLIEAFVKTDIAFRNELISQHKLRRITQKDWHPGCTAVTVLIVNNMLYIANAGDCRVVLCRNGYAIPLTKVTRKYTFFFEINIYFHFKMYSTVDIGSCCKLC